MVAGPHRTRLPLEARAYADGRFQRRSSIAALVGEARAAVYRREVDSDEGKCSRTRA